MKTNITTATISKSEEGLSYDQIKDKEGVYRIFGYGANDNTRFIVLNNQGLLFCNTNRGIIEIAGSVWKDGNYKFLPAQQELTVTFK